MRFRGERGAGAIGCLFLIAVVGAAVYAGFMFAMPKFQNSAFEDRINETIVHFVKQPPDDVRKQIIRTAEEFDIVLRPEDVSVKVEGDRRTIDIRYEKLIDLKVWQKTLVFQSHRSGTF